MASKRRFSAQTHAAITRFALGLPGATEDFPWGERVAKVNKKVFVFLGREPGGLSVKLPESGLEVLALPGAEPTGYGLGKSGWISIDYETARVPVDVLCAWIEESYRAVAPKRLSTAGTKSKAPAKKAAKKTPKKRPARKAAKRKTPRRA